jgi:TIGR00341 family protein
MAYRLIIATIPQKKRSDNIESLLERYEVLSMWYGDSSDGQMILNILIRREKTEAILNLLQEHCSDVEGFRVILVPVEASIPLPEVPVRILPEEHREEDTLIVEGLVDRLGSKELVDRLSRQEIYADISDISRVSNVYIVMIILSSLVAAIGVLNNNVAVIIGAMVIAPLFGPNIALSLATVLGDMDLAINALKTNLTGISTALAISVLLGFFSEVDPTIPELFLRTNVGLGSVTLALSSGIVGALAFTRGFRTTLVGVMVAVALLPHWLPLDYC